MRGTVVQVIGAAAVERDDARSVGWRDARFDKYASAPARMLVEAVSRAWTAPGHDAGDRVGVYLATGETGLDLDAFLGAARIAWDDHRDDPDYRWMGGRALRAIDPYYSLRTLSNGPAALLAMHLDATGPSLNVAHQRAGVAWALLAALDDLHRGLADIACVGACDVPRVVSRRAVARRRGLPAACDNAAVVVLRRATAGAWPAVRFGVRCGSAASEAEARTIRDGSVAADATDYGVVAPLRALVAHGLATQWTTPFAIAIDEPGQVGIVIDVEAGRDVAATA